MKYFFAALALCGCFLLQSLDISSSEAKDLFSYAKALQSQGLVALFNPGFALSAKLAFHSSSLLPKSNVALRIVPFIFTLASIYLLYLQLEKLRAKDKFIALFSLSLLPVMLAAGCAVNDGSLLLFLLLLFCHLHPKKSCAIPAFFILLLPQASLIFSLALFAFYAQKRLIKGSALALLLFLFAVFLHGFDFGGKPRGYFTDVLGLLALAFTPILFLYIFYCIYRDLLALKKRKSLDLKLSFAATGLFLCLMLSLRQKLDLEYFLPFLLLYYPRCVLSFAHSYYLRLPMHRGFYKSSLNLALSLIFSFALILLGSEALFYTDLEPKKHFLINYKGAKALSDELKKLDISCLANASQRLGFYGIENSSKCPKIRECEEAEIFIYLGKNKVFYCLD